jgi:hypothetical protein
MIRKLHFLLIGMFMFVLHSCSSKRFVGTYINDKKVYYADRADSIANESLELKSDGTFTHEMIWAFDYADDYGPSYDGSIYAGRYVIKNGEVYLNGDPKLLIDSQTIVRLTPRYMQPELTKVSYLQSDTLAISNRHGVIRLGKYLIKQKEN